TRDELDTLWDGFETAPASAVVVQSAAVYAGEWPIPADVRGDLRIDRPKVAASFKELAGDRPLSVAHAELLIDRCLANGALASRPSDPTAAWKQAVFSQLRKDMFRYTLGPGDADAEVCVELGPATGVREVR